MSAPLKILFCIEDLQMNGGTRSLLALLAALRGRPYEVDVFLFSHAGELTKEIPGWVRVLPEIPAYAAERLPLRKSLAYSFRRLRLDLMAMRLIVSFARGIHWPFPCWFMLPPLLGEWDVAISYSDGFQVQMLARKVSARRKIGWIHSVYSNYIQSKDTYRAFDEIDQAVAVSRSAGQAFESCFEQALGRPYGRALAYVHNIVDLAACQKRANEFSVPKKQCFRIVTVGRISHEKGTDLIPRAARLLKDAGIAFEWIVIGAGNPDFTVGVKQLVETQAVGDCVVFTGMLENPMPWVLSADVIVQPSRSEAAGISVVEALTIGKRVVCSDIPAFREQLPDWKGGTIFGTTAEELSSCLKDILGSRSECSQGGGAERLPTLPENVIREFERVVG